MRCAQPALTVDVVDAYRNVLPESAPIAAARGAGCRNRCGDVYQFIERDAPGRGGAGGRHCISVCGRAGDFDRADYQPTLREFGWEPAAEANVSVISELVSAG